METWAIVELMGHVRMAGRLTEEEHFGAKLGRLDIPQQPDPGCPQCLGKGLTGEPGALLACTSPSCSGVRTQFFGGSSVYRVTPCTEEVARLIASKSNVEPVRVWELPRLPAPRSTHPEGERWDDEDNQ